MTSSPTRWLLSALLVLGLACDSGPNGAGRADLAPVAIADQQGVACGRPVRGEPAPRAQIVHRDGQRFFSCSIGDGIAYLAAPSAHGPIEAIFVEVLEPDEDPLVPQAAPHDWVLAEKATFVVGVDRPGIASAPILAYADRETAVQLIRAHDDAYLLDLHGVRQWWEEHQASR